jgi:predicted AAA+ superfamily ATPase
VRDHFQILEDTLVAYLVPPFRGTPTRKPVAASKLYFFDIGVANVLLRRGPVQARSESFGRALEHLVFLELRAFLDYQRLDVPLSFWRTHEGYEVDFLAGSSAIEVKKGHAE